MAGETKQAKDSKIRQLRDENGSLKARIEELLIATAPGNLATLEDSSKLKADIAVLNDSVKAKDTQIAQLQDSLTKSDAAFLTVKAELADAISYEHERAIVVDFLDKLTPEGKTLLGQRLGLATVEDSAELKDTPQPQDELLPNKVPGTTQGGATAARDAHNVEAEGSTPSPATKPEVTITVPVNDVHPETPGEKWWREFQANLNK